MGRSGKRSRGSRAGSMWTVGCEAYSGSVHWLGKWGKLGRGEGRGRAEGRGQRSESWRGRGLGGRGWTGWLGCAGIDRGAGSQAARSLGHRAADSGNEGRRVGWGQYQKGRPRCVQRGRLRFGRRVRRHYEGAPTCDISSNAKEAAAFGGLCTTRSWVPGRPLTDFGRRRPNLPLPRERVKNSGPVGRCSRLSWVPDDGRSVRARH